MEKRIVRGGLSWLNEQEMKHVARSIELLQTASTFTATQVGRDVTPFQCSVFQVTIRNYAFTEQSTRRTDYRR